MRPLSWPLRQRDRTTCGPAVAVLAGLILDPGYGSAAGNAAVAGDWFTLEQGQVHARVNRVWPKALGTTPLGMARAITRHSGRRGVRYFWRLRWGRGDWVADLAAALGSGWPVAVLLGGFIPRHWVLAIEIDGQVVRCYEPSSGSVRAVSVDSLRAGRLSGLGFPRPFAVVLPRSP